MKRIHPGDVEPARTNSPATVRLLADALGTDRVAINHFTVDPGQTIGYEYHRHLDQEELFVVLDGSITFRTESGPVAVSTDEIIRFESGELQLGRNDDDEPATVLAIGIPPDSTEVEYLHACPRCGEETIQRAELTENPAVIRIRCSDCDAITDEISL